MGGVETWVSRENPGISYLRGSVSEGKPLSLTHSLEMDLKSRLTQLVTLSPMVLMVELTYPDGYSVLGMRRLEIKYGASIVAELCCPDGAKVSTFLPARLSSKLSDADIEELSQGLYFLRCTGKTGRSLNPSQDTWIGLLGKEPRRTSPNALRPYLMGCVETWVDYSRIDITSVSACWGVLTLE
ncbi:hypothetical protein J6590_015823 [Homalodisca vitripennis]|nr:hypothetical protein J6590_015823 [Homalodisca vitripennis]